MARQNKRRILPNIAWKAERYFMVLEFVLLMTAMIYLLYLIFSTIYGVVNTMTPANQAALGPVFDKINFLLLVRITILFFAAFLINVLLGLFFLHRVTGPLVRFKAVLNQIADGTVPNTDVVLRKGDFPTDVAQALTQALKRIRNWKRG